VTVGIPLTGHVNQERLSRFTYLVQKWMAHSGNEKFAPEHSWIDVRQAKNDQGRILHTRGVTPSPGLCMLGLTWLHTRGSALLGWVGNDAAFLAAQIACANR